MVRPKIEVVTASASARQRRSVRRPQHPFNVTYRPFEICPFFIAPVLPGETLDNLLMQAYVVSDPVLNPQIGWWQEKYFFYVPHLALETGENPPYGPGELTEIHVNAGVVLNNLELAANDPLVYGFKTGEDFVTACLQVVIARFFRDENDEGTMAAIVDYPGAYVDQRHWGQSLKLESVTTEDDELPGVDDIEDLDVLANYTAARDQWEIMRDSGTQDVTYEDYLRAQGVRISGRTPVESEGVPNVYPELIRFTRNFKYPTNHIDPTDGSPTSALVWTLNERADKARYFKEPGFLFAVSVCRPKFYMSTQKGTITGLMTQADYWLPKVLQGYPYTSVKEVVDSATEGPLQNQAEDYWFDVKDLFLYGEQFVNRAMTVAGNHAVPLPDDTLNKRYVDDTMAKSFFVDAGGTKNFIKEDGVVHLNIRSGIGPDTTP